MPGSIGVQAEPGRLVMILVDPGSGEYAELEIGQAIVLDLLTDLAKGAVLAYGLGALDRQPEAQN